MIAAALVITVLSAEPSAAAFQQQGEQWDVTASVDGKAVPSKPAKVVLQVTAREGFKINEEYPISFRPKEGANVGFPKKRFDKSDGLVLEQCSGKKEPCTARLPVTFTPNAAGKAQVEGTFAFSVCNAERCLIDKVQVSVPVTAAAP